MSNPPATLPCPPDPPKSLQLQYVSNPEVFDSHSLDTGCRSRGLGFPHRYLATVALAGPRSIPHNIPCFERR